MVKSTMLNTVTLDRAALERAYASLAQEPKPKVLIMSPAQHKEIKRLENAGHYRVTAVR